MNKELNPAQRRIIKIQTVIDFEKEPKIRHKVLEIEDRVREILPQAAFVGPVPENEPEEVPRVIFPGMESCSFSQIRMDYVVQVQKDRSREVNKVLRETEQKANRIFGAFQEHTGRAITRMGVIVHFVFPLAAKKSSLTYLHRTFFKADFTPPNLTELDFHFVQQSQAKYNINWLIKAVKVSDGAQRDAVLVLMDVNNYLEKTNKKIVSYPNDVIKKLFAFIKEQIRTKLPAVVRNQFTLE
ncbi:MAG: hypothetical protein KAX39_01520 [candidate division Zixibacteria bacterium]|nr:hypothetical protein [candidate division Zixibacteria bacterium]